MSRKQEAVAEAMSNEQEAMEDPGTVSIQQRNYYKGNRLQLAACGLKLSLC